MGSRQLVVFGLVLVCVGLSGARVLGSREPTYRRLAAQKPAEVARPRAEPERGHSRPSAEPARGLQVKVYPGLEPLTWSFPVDPVDPVDPPLASFEPLRPDRTERVAVRCGERALQVEVSQDLLGRGLVDPQRVTLGGCPVKEVDHLAHVLVFESDLHGCGSTLVMTDSAFIYAFTLVYEPAAWSQSAVITRSQGAVVGVECHYPR